MRLLLVRHGQSQANIDGVIQGADDPLTDLGRQQAHRAGRWIGDRHEATHLYASPLARARETAEIIGTFIDREPELVAGLAEINAGHAVGMTWDAWSAANPEQAARIRSTERTIEDRWEGGESGQEFIDRVFAAYDEIVTRHLGSDDVVVVVSHGGPLAWIAARLHGEALDRWPFTWSRFMNCSITDIEIDEEGAHTVCALNDIAHLEGLDDI